MRILVVEDKESHRRAAIETLPGHQLTIAKSFDEAMNLMRAETDEEKLQLLLAEMGFSGQPNREDQERWNAYWEAYDEAQAESEIPLPFDVVLTDMMMPMSEQTLSRSAFNPGEQIPYGFIIALRAAQRGAKFVAMLTDTNHHKGAMSAALDHLSSGYYQYGFVPNFAINGARAMFVHAPFVRGQKACELCGGSGSCKYCGGTGQRNDQGIKSACGRCHRHEVGEVGRCDSCEGSGKVRFERSDSKDWGRVLADLIA